MNRHPSGVLIWRQVRRRDYTAGRRDPRGERQLHRSTNSGEQSTHHSFSAFVPDFQEIYLQPYDSIDFSKHRNNVHEKDIYQPHHPVLDGLNEILAVYEQCPLSPLRKMGVDRAYDLVVVEDENTGYQTIGPVSKMFNMVCRWHREGAESDAFRKHCDKVDDFLWMSGEGLMMTGTNGSQLWDAAFISQALVETGLGEEVQNRQSAKEVLDWLDKCQMRENPKCYGRDYRHATKGAWPFSTPEQGYTVSLAEEK